MINREKQDKMVSDSMKFLQTYLFLEAVNSNNVERASEFLDANLGVNIHYNNDTALFLAIKNDSVKMVNFLLFEATNPILLDKKNNLTQLKVCLYENAKHNKNEVIKYFLLNENIRKILNSESITEGFFVIYEKNIEMIKFLLENVSIDNYKNQQNFLINSACVNKNYAMIEVLLDAKIDISKRMINNDAENFIQMWQLKEKMKEDLSDNKDKDSKLKI